MGFARLHDSRGRSRAGGDLGNIAAEIPIPQELLFDPAQDPVKGNARLAVDGESFVLVSTGANRVRVALVPAQGAATVAPAIELGGPGSALPGLTRLDVSSVRVEGSWLSIALTAHLNHPGIGASSVGAVLRMAPSGARDPSFGENGLWVSPLTNVFRQFICAGEFPGGVVGIQDTEVIAYGIALGGGNLDDQFGVDGVFRRSLGGGGLSSPVAAHDGQWTYAFARRPDGRVVGCKFNRQGVGDAGFGDGGLADVPSDGMSIIAPTDIKVSAGRVGVALTRSVRGVDCDRVPSMVLLDANSGQPDAAFGAAGFAFHSAVGEPAVVCADGSSYYRERPSADQVGMNLRRADAAGRFERVITVRAPRRIGSQAIESLWALEDGSLLIGGYGSSGWVAKLTPAGAPDPSFGDGGFAIPQQRVRGSVRILGVRADGKIAIEFDDSGLRPAIGLLNADGAVDATYAEAEPNRVAGGFVELYGFSHLGPAFPYARPFLDADGSILCLVSSTRIATNAPSVQAALRRIAPDGTYDPTFGLGPPSVNPPDAQQAVRFEMPSGGTGGRDGFYQVHPVGFGWLGGMLYVIASGWTGVPPRPGDQVVHHDVLVVSRWNAQGRKDQTFGAGGWQDAGFSPERLDFGPQGVLSIRGDEPFPGRPVGDDRDGRLVVFGTAGWSESATVTVGDQTFTRTVKRRAEPALFSVSHPGGIDLTFGGRGHGAEFLQMQEFAARMIAARLLRPTRPRFGPRVRFVCADDRRQPINGKLTSNFGGVGQFRVGGPVFTPV